ncbi:AMP-binding protein [Alcaligenaceae bacterium]|nr:AMP-binding protein [Alcaligenaceae bacterium]
MSSTDLQKLPATLHALLDSCAIEAPNRPFILNDGRWWTFKELQHYSRMVARQLASLGVKAGDHVVVMMPTSERYLAFWFAISRLGAVEVPINGAYKGEVLEHVLRTAAPSIAVVASEHRHVFDRACNDILQPSQVHDPQDYAFAWSDTTIDGASDTAAIGDATSAESPASIIFTSGTTGVSKGVVSSHHQQMCFGHFFREIVKFSEDDVAYNFLPFFHIAAKFQTIGAMLARGRMMLRTAFSLSAFWDDVRASEATLCVAVGGLCNMLHGQPERTDDAYNSLRLIYAVPMPWAFKETFERRFDLQLVEAYGATESNLVLYTRLGEATPAGTCGRANPAFEITIRDAQGAILPLEEVGEICIRPRHPNTIMSGYLGLADATADAVRGGYFHSGDNGYMNEDGFIFFLDRSKDSIRRRGENISSYEVERALNAHHDVAEVAVIPIKADIGEDELKATVVIRPGSNLRHQAFLEYAFNNLPYFMVPRFIEFREQLPRTDTMKVRKVDLRRDGITPDTWDCERNGLRVTRRGIEKIEFTR